MKKKLVKGIVLGLTCAGMAGMFTGCSSDDEYEETLESGYEKYNDGEEMTEEEYNAVKGFNDWKDKQGEKSYDDWDDQ